MIALKKGLSAVAALCIAITLLAGISTTAYADNWTDSGNVATSFALGTGTADDPYQIATASQLAYLAQQVNAGVESYQSAHYVLTADIDLSAHEWVPIGGMCSEDSNYVPNGNSFKGVFNGYYNNSVHNITGMTVSGDVDINGVAGYGLFGYVNGGAVGNVNVSGTVSVTGSAEYVGGLIGYTSGNVYNCDCNVVVSAANSSNVGGIVGAAERRDSCGLTIKYCKNSGSVTGGKRVGGIAGALYSATGYIATVDCCANEANVKAEKYGKVYAGGVVGYTRGDILHSYNTGAVEANTSQVDGGRYVGGITGILNGYTTPYANLKYSYSSTGTIRAYNDYKALFASADTSTNPEITNVFWNSTYNVSQDTTGNWGTCTNVYGVESFDSEVVNALNEGLSTNDNGFVYVAGGTPKLTDVEDSSYVVSANLLTAVNATGTTDDTDDASMLFVDYTSGSDTAGNGSKTAPYKTISKALSDVSSSRNVIYLLSTYPINTNTTITSTADVTIKRSCQNHDYLFEVTGGTLTLQNITIDGNKSSIEVAGKSLINVNGGSLSIEGATLQNNFANSGGAVRVINGTAIMSSGYISNNQAVDNGGGVMVSGTGITSFGLFAITGGTITGNNATNGGGIAITNHGQASMGATNTAALSIFANTAATYGGGVYADGSFTMTSGTIEGNSLAGVATSAYKNCGEGVYVSSNGTFNVSKTAAFKISDTVYLSSGKNLTITGSISGITGKITLQKASAAVGTTVAVGTSTRALTNSDVAKLTYKDTTYGIERSGNLATLKLANTSKALAYDEEENSGYAFEQLSEQDNALISLSGDDYDYTFADGQIIDADNYQFAFYEEGTEDDHITIGISGTVSVDQEIFFGSYVDVYGIDENATLKSTNGQFKIFVCGESSPVNATFNNLTIDCAGNQRYAAISVNNGTLTMNNVDIVNVSTPTGNILYEGAVFALECNGEVSNIIDTSLILNNCNIESTSTTSPAVYIEHEIEAFDGHSSVILKNCNLNTIGIKMPKESLKVEPTGNVTVDGAVTAKSITVTQQEGYPIKEVKVNGAAVSDYSTLSGITNGLSVTVDTPTPAPTFAASIANVPTTAVAPGETFTADVILTSDTIPASACLDLTVNSDVAKVIAVTPAEGVGANAQGSFATDGSTAKVSFYGNTAEAKDGLKVATVTFEAVKEGSASIALVSTEDSVAGITGDPSAEYKITVPAAATQVTVKYPLLESVSFGGNYCLAKYTPNAALPNTQVVKYGEQTMYLAEDGSWYCTIAKDVTPSLDSITVVEGTPTAYKDLAKGDVNENDRINIVDAQIAYDVATAKFSGFDKLSALGVFKADVNNDKALDATDAFAIQVYVHTGSFAVVD